MFPSLSSADASVRPAGNGTQILAACTLDLWFGRIHRDGEVIRLTYMETQLLQYLIDRPGISVSRAELLEKVWNYRSSNATRAVDLAIRRLRLKLERNPAAPDHLCSSRGEGYHWSPVAGSNLAAA